MRKTSISAGVRTNGGWKTWFADAAEFVHLGGASSDRRWASRERSARIGQAEAEMIRDHLSPVRAAVTIGLMRAGPGRPGGYFGLVAEHLGRGQLPWLARGPRTPGNRGATGGSERRPRDRGRAAAVVGFSLPEAIAAWIAGQAGRVEPFGRIRL